MKNQTQSLVGIRALLQNSWQVYKKEFRVFLGVLVPAFVVAIGAGLVGYLQSPIIGVLFNLIGLIVSLWVGLSLLYVMKDREVGIGAREALQKGWRRLLSYLWIIVLVSFITTGGFFLLIIPGIILSIWFSSAVYVFVAEDKRGMTALLRSKHLVSGYWWGVFWRSILLGLVGFLFILPFIILEFAFGAGIGFLSGFEGEEQIGGNIKAVIRIPFGFVQWLFSAFAVAYAYLLYENLRDLKASTLFEEPTRGKKIKYLLFGVFGIIGLLIVFALLVVSFILINL